MTHFARLLFVALFVLASAAVAIPAEQADAASEQPYRGRYIVVLDLPGNNVQGVVDNLSRQAGFETIHVYDDALQGFSAELSSAHVRALRRVPMVRSITPDVRVEAFDQTSPTGVRRIGTDDNATADIDNIDDRVGIDVAILDTGIDPGHQDLNVAGGYNCTSSNTGAYADGAGHGTHVAGSVGALDNNVGVVGVAPGANLWAVKVLDDSGSGSWSEVICGLDWVAENSETIDVANMSLGGNGSESDNCGYGSTEDPLHQAVCEVVNDNGVTITVAAGNNGSEVDNAPCGFWGWSRCTIVPAAYPEVITVGAIVDTDGDPGGDGSSTSYGDDDTRASFSNYGPLVDIYAPGTLIRSTTPGNNYSSYSGTSMASPHVAGAAALYLNETPGSSPDTVRQALDDLGEPGVDGNSRVWDSHGQVLVNVSSFAPPEPVYDVAVTAVDAPDSVFVDESVDVTVSVENVGNQEMQNVDVALEIDDAQHDSTTVSLNPGQTQNVVFEDWTPGSTGTYELVGTASHVDDSNAANDSASTNIDVTERAYDVSIVSMSAPSSVTQGQSATVNVEVQNDSTQTESFSVSLTSNPANGAGDPSDQTIQDLPAGDSQTVSFNWATSESTSLGVYDLTATASVVGQSAQDSETIQIEVVDLPSMHVEDITASSSGWWLFGFTLNGNVLVHDGDGQPVANASVSVSVSGPTSWTATPTTNSNGVASFSRSGLSRGTYTIAVENVTHDGYVYDEAQNNKTTHEHVIQ